MRCTVKLLLLDLSKVQYMGSLMSGLDLSYHQIPLFLQTYVAKVQVRPSQEGSQITKSAQVIELGLMLGGKGDELLGLLGIMTMIRREEGAHIYCIKRNYTIMNIKMVSLSNML